MFKLDNDFLTSMGLGSLPVNEKNKLLQAIYERLEMNVGMRLAENMTEDQLNEFEGFIDRSDEAGALKWLEANFPNYKQVVAEELEKLKTEVSASAPQILAAVQGSADGQQPGAPADGQHQQDPAPPMEQQPAPPAPDVQPPNSQPSPEFTPQEPQSSPPPTPWDQPPPGPGL